MNNHTAKPAGNDAANPELRVTAGRMRQLLREGTAVPLLDNFFPVPANVDGVWWYVPVESADHSFVPAAPEQAASFERLAQRRRAARIPSHNDRSTAP